MMPETEIEYRAPSIDDNGEEMNLRAERSGGLRFGPFALGAD